MAALRSLICALALVALTSCVTPLPQSRERVARESFAAAAEDRPGLGTGWGETRESRSVDTQFRRANSTRPSALTRIYYNDAAGIRANGRGYRAATHLAGVIRRRENFISVGLRDESSRFLPGLIVGDRWFVVGEQGRRYSMWCGIEVNSAWKFCCRWMALMCSMGGKLRSRSEGMSFDRMAS